MASGDLKSDLERLSRSTSRREIWQITLDMLHERDVARVAFLEADLGARGVRIISDGFAKAWVDTYIANKYIEIDPIPKLAARMAAPFYWHQIEDLVDVDPRMRKFLADLRADGMGDGIAFSLFGPQMNNAFISIGFDVDRLSLSPEKTFEVQTIVQAAYLRYCALNEKARPKASLSNRETEVLRWVAKGKSNSVIADILGISPHTVDAHMRNIYTKLDVADRTSAAISGLGEGLVQYPDHVITG